MCAKRKQNFVVAGSLNSSVKLFETTFALRIENSTKWTVVAAGMEVRHPAFAHSNSLIKVEAFFPRHFTSYALRILRLTILTGLSTLKKPCMIKHRQVSAQDVWAAVCYDILSDTKPFWLEMCKDPFFKLQFCPDFGPTNQPIISHLKGIMNPS